MSLETHQLVLEPLGHAAWRLCDQAVAPNDPLSLVAYVEERRDGRYAVTWIAHGPATGTYATIGALLREAARRVHGHAPSSATKPVPIAHRPPLAVR